MGKHKTVAGTNERETFNILVGKIRCPMQLEQAGKYIIDKMRMHLPAHLVYHSVEHVQDVYHAAELIGQQENITPYEMQLLLTAAFYHDAGFLIKADGHEEESCIIAKDILPRYRYTTEEIDRVCGLIRATRLPQNPQNNLEQILADADLDYLGRTDYFEVSHKLYLELLNTGVISTPEEWKQVQISFLKNHHYFTPTSITLREAPKKAILEQIKATTLLSD